MEGRPALGSATRSPHILELRLPWGGPRFYLPGEHPATYRLRCTRCALLTGEADTLHGPGRDLLAEIDRQLANFEVGEDRAKREAWERLRRAGQPVCLACWRHDLGHMEGTPPRDERWLGDVVTCWLCGRPTNSGIWLNV